MACTTRLGITLVLVLLAPARALAQPAPTAPTPQESPGPARGEPPSASDAPARAPEGPLLVEPPPPSESGAAPRAPAPPTTIVVSNARRDAKQDARIRTLERRVARDEKRIAALEERHKLFEHLKLEAFIQPQLLVQTYNTAASPNLQNGVLPPGIGANETIAKTDGTTTNGTFFRVRRARMRTFYETDAMRLFLQIDGLPAGGVGPGIGTILRNAEATAKVRWTHDVRTELIAGLFFTPFRAELLEASLARPFIERTWFVQNVFPTERDYGAHVKTFASKDRLVVDLAIVNGQRLGERTFVALPDLNRSKDFIAYVTHRLGDTTVGASGYVGRGQLVDPVGLRFKQYSKWAVNLQASKARRFFRRVGESRLSAELTMGANMDTGVNYRFALPAIPTDIGADVEDVHQRALYLRFEQDVCRAFTFGYRYDTYTPNSAIKNNARDTHAFLAVWKVSPNLRFMNELGWAIDNVHPSSTPPPSKHIVYFSSVLQAMF